MKYLKHTTLGCKDLGIRKSEFVAKTQFLWYLDKCWIFYLRLFWLISRWTKVDISELKTPSSISSSSGLNEMVTFSRLRSRLKDCPCIRVSVEQDDISRTLRFIFLRRARHLYYKVGKNSKKTFTRSAIRLEYSFSFNFDHFIDQQVLKTTWKN